MNWFKKLFACELKKQPSPTWLHDWKRLRSSFYKGRTFQYLGRNMLVIEHVEYIPSFHMVNVRYIPAVFPKIVCEYVDDRGVIRVHKFGLGHINYLLGVVQNEKI